MAFFLAMILGMVSPKIITAMVSTTVDTHVQLSPMSFTTMREPSEEVAMFTRLLPTRMADRVLSNFSMIRRASLALEDPDSAAFSSRSLLAEEKVISDAEKKADRATQMTMATIWGM